MLKRYTATVKGVTGRQFSFLVLGRTIDEAIRMAEDIFPSDMLKVTSQ